MGNAARKLSNGSAAHAKLEPARARLVRRGPRGPVSLPLRAMRESSGLTQKEVAKASGLAQPEISKLETATSFDDRMVATLRRYLNAIGDDLELVSVSEHGHRIGVVGIEEPRKSSASAVAQHTEDDLDDLLARVARAASDRAEMRTATHGEIELAMILEAAAHRRAAGTKRGAGIAIAAAQYLDALPPVQRLRSPQLVPASKWTRELRVYVEDAFDEYSKLPKPRDPARVTAIASTLVSWVYDVIPRRITALAVDPPPKVSTASDLVNATPKVSAALVARGADVETVLRALLSAVGFTAADIQRLTKAEYQKRHRAGKKRRAQAHLDVKKRSAKRRAKATTE